MAVGSNLLKAWQKYRVVLFFPAFTASTIYADLAHTRQWKQSQLEARRSVELLQ